MYTFTYTDTFTKHHSMTPQFSQLPLGALRQHLGTAAAVGAAEAPEVHAAGSADR